MRRFMLISCPAIAVVLVAAAATQRVGTKDNATNDLKKPAQQPKTVAPAPVAQPTTPAVRTSPLRLVERALGRGLVMKDPVRRSLQLRKASRLTEELLQQGVDDIELSLTLLGYRARAHAALTEYRTARKLIVQQQNLVRERLPSVDLGLWIEEEAQRMANLNQWPLARFHLEEALANEPDEELAAVHDLRIGDLLISQGKLGQAERHFQKIVTKRPAHAPAALFRLARLAFIEEDLQKLERYYRRLSTVAPDSPESEDARHMLRARQADAEQDNAPLDDTRP